MSAIKFRTAVVTLLIGTLPLGGEMLLGQHVRQPSQRYQPTAVNQTPPSVHVDPAAASRIPTHEPQGTSYTLSDQVAQEQIEQPGRYLIRQVAYQQPANPATETANVPTTPKSAVSLRKIFETRSEQIAQQTTADITGKIEAAGSQIEQAAGQMDQAIRSTTGEQAESISAQRAQLESQLRQIKARTEAKKRELAAAAAMTSSAPDATSSTAQQSLPVDDGFSATQFMSQINGGTKGQQSPAAIRQVGSTRSIQQPDQRQGVAQTESQPLVATRAAFSQNDSDSQPRSLRSTQRLTGTVRQVSNEDDIAGGSRSSQDAAIRLNAPSIEVETFGPRAIGINKPATYEVVVKNNSNSVAERILVGINLPQWVEVSNVNLTTGGKEITDGNDKARLVWTIDRIASGQTQTATILAIPRKAEMFDVGVEWTLVPRTGKANIQVTEPKLEMNISGPADVEFGQVARYLVTVRNPGTGTAENVTVKLPEALGGERSALGDIAAGSEEVFQVELLARTAGELNLIAQATADGEVEASSERTIKVRRAQLDVMMEGPAMKFSGDTGTYTISMTNSGDAAANNLMAAVALPTGAKYLSGIDSVTPIDDGVRWQVSPLEPGQTRTYKVVCQLNGSGDLQLECGVRQGDLAASAACVTRVETVADLVLEVQDPRGPLPTNKNVPYIISIRNRGSRAAKGLDLVIQFSEGIEPNSVQGHEHRIVPGQVLFSPIEVVEPGQEVRFEVTAAAHQQGTHIFRAQLTCDDSDSREIAEGTTRYFSSDGETGQSTSTANAGSATIGGGDFQR